MSMCKGVESATGWQKSIKAPCGGLCATNKRLDGSFHLLPSSSSSFLTFFCPFFRLGLDQLFFWCRYWLVFFPVEPRATASKLFLLVAISIQSVQFRIGGQNRPSELLVLASGNGLGFAI